MHWHEEPGGGGFWSITRHADLIAVNRDAHVFSSAEQGISIPDIDDGGAMVREMMLYMDPPRHTRYRLLVNKGFTPRMIGLLEAHLTAKAAAIVDNVVDARARATSSATSPPSCPCRPSPSSWASPRRIGASCSTGATA